MEIRDPQLEKDDEHKLFLAKIFRNDINVVARFKRARKQLFQNEDEHVYLSNEYRAAKLTLFEVYDEHLSDDDEQIQTPITKY